MTHHLDIFMSGKILGLNGLSVCGMAQLKPLEGNPATFNPKSVTANANGKETKSRFILMMSMEERLR